MEQLGIEPVQLATQLFNFLLMVALLTRFLYKPILKNLKARRDAIAEGLAYTEKAKAEAEKTEAKRQRILLEAKEDATVIVEESKKSAKLQETEIVAKARDEARAIVQKAKSEIEMERADMEKKVREQMIDVATAIALKALASTLTGSAHHAVIAKKIQMIAKRRL